MRQRAPSLFSQRRREVVSRPSESSVTNTAISGETIPVHCGPSIVVVDKGAAGALTTTTLQDDIYVFFFDQEGLMAGLGLQGTKISRIQPEN
jgi:hypothetical protein